MAKQPYTDTHTHTQNDKFELHEKKICYRQLAIANVALMVGVDCMKQSNVKQQGHTGPLFQKENVHKVFILSQIASFHVCKTKKNKMYI